MVPLSPAENVNGLQKYKHTQTCDVCENTVDGR